MSYISPLKTLFKKHGIVVSNDLINDIINDIFQKLNKSIMVIDEGEKPFYVGIYEILYVDKPAKDFYIHTKNATYKYHDRKVDLIDVLSYEDGFEIVDKRLIVNLNKVKKYDSDLRIMYFHSSASSEYPLVGYAGRFNSLIKSRLGKEKDIVYDYKIK